MTYALVILPLISSLAMWLTVRIFIPCFFRPYKRTRIAGIALQGILPKYQPVLARKIAGLMINELAANEEIRSFITGPEVLKKIMPSIETNLDHFLNVKLKEALPVISMFVGEKVTHQLKVLFMAELELLFPSVMSQLFDGLQQNKELEDFIYVKLTSVNIQEIESAFNNSFKKEVKRLETISALIGFATGILQAIVIIQLLN